MKDDKEEGMHSIFTARSALTSLFGSAGLLVGLGHHFGGVVRGVVASVLTQVGPEESICNMLNAIKGWTGILVFAAAIAIGFALILRGLAPEFSNQFQGAIRSVIVGLIIISVLPLVATFILTSLGATGTGTGCS
jgi:hypothetical protein